MPLRPRIYAIPKMAPADVSKSASPVARMVRDNDNFLARTASKPTDTASYDEWLDSIGPDNYCRHHDMYRPCQWCD